MKQLEPVKAANNFIDKHFPECQGAILAGSVVRGEDTETSDLDLVIFDKKLASSYRESMFDFGWPIEIFVHNLTFYKYFMEMDCKSAKPSMPRMISEGIILKDEGIIESIKKEAADMLVKGPEKWTDNIIRTKRYFITDALDDFTGSNNRAEDIFIANTLAQLIHEFILRTNGRWIGSSKWIVRALNDYNENFTERFVDAFDVYYRTGEKGKIVKLVDNVLAPYGGRLFEGFCMGKGSVK
ncbi:nucleotidyltransferase domain-containing protein [Gracilibacillus caseinilyticus]|uniref:Nucleotidyltransferase domain-containing protein n=1 Tax=Gracilibacillus caseinilyticus TaxID=2932256 RepID=A0ABY4EWB9_9BACI|nr:nucleotidyltransferase domain-containing protein [Gracilibacillus caseinilyticus]UOQ48712.1 nucleotidyltransferase domain-containing protein [Gracilibacillus caseinilyticus]